LRKYETKAKGILPSPELLVAAQWNNNRIPHPFCGAEFKFGLMFVSRPN